MLFGYFHHRFREVLGERISEIGVSNGVFEHRRVSASEIVEIGTSNQGPWPPIASETANRRRRETIFDSQLLEGRRDTSVIDLMGRNFVPSRMSAQKQEIRIAKSQMSSSDGAEGSRNMHGHTA